MSMTAFLVLAATVTMSCATAPATRQESIEQWADRHPEAARELGEWVRVHPEAAARFFEWDGHHPEKSHEFVTWTISNQGAGLDAFVVTHRGWPVFDQIMERHRPAAESFMQWARRHPQAAESLMRHPGGLDWAGHHIYAGYWTMANG